MENQPLPIIPTEPGNRQTVISSLNANDCLPVRRSQTSPTDINVPLNLQNRPESISEEERKFSEDIAKLDI